jgi:hypothetical protein
MALASAVVAACVLASSTVASANMASIGARPSLPRTWAVVEGATGTLLAEGRLFYYYWEDGDRTYRWYGGALRDGYSVPWPEATPVEAGTELRLRMERAQWPSAGMQLLAWRATRRSNGFPRGPKTRFRCRLEPAESSCTYQPALYEGKPMWDATLTLPDAHGDLFIYLIPSWWDIEGGNPDNVQEAGWLFRLRLTS